LGTFPTFTSFGRGIALSSFEQIINKITKKQVRGEQKNLSELIDMFSASAEDSNFEHFEPFLRFLFLSGHYEKFIRLFLRQLEILGDSIEKSKLPWTLLLESILRLDPALPSYIRSSIYDLINEIHLKLELCQSEKGRLALPELREEFERLREQADEELVNLKRSLFEQARTYEIQNLPDLQKKILERLKKIDPNDSRIAEEQRRLLEKGALDVLSRKSLFHKKLELREEKDVELEKLAEFIKDEFQKHVEPYEAAVALLTWGFPQQALSLVEQNKNKQNQFSSEMLWLYAELLLQVGRFADLLQFLFSLEQTFPEDSDTFFKTAYLRAQCYWGLGQKQLAIDTLESLLTTKPDYRSGPTLLVLWRAEE
jgi:tetratricopeptide (TPR) repeat protein